MVLLGAHTILHVSRIRVKILLTNSVLLKDKLPECSRNWYSWMRMMKLAQVVSNWSTVSCQSFWRIPWSSLTDSCDLYLRPVLCHQQRITWKLSATNLRNINYSCVRSGCFGYHFTQCLYWPIISNKDLWKVTGQEDINVEIRKKN